MSRTVSFRCSEELDEFLEQEAERRMTTKSTVAQMLIAEKARELQESDARNAASGGSDAGASEGVNTGGDDVFSRHPDAWYRPDGQYDYAVYVPEETGVHDAGEPRYYQTKSGAAEALQRWYE